METTTTSNLTEPLAAEWVGHSVQRCVRGHGRKHLDLFSGGGGFSLAAEAVGFETIAFSEIEPYACKILKQTWPDVPNLGDLRNIHGISADLITGGFPCQPFSHAGKRRGAEDDRHLWPEMCRIIADAKPAWVLGENVAGIIGMELDSVLADLESLGYAAWPLVIPACALDARHRRDRVWIAAYSASGLLRAEQERQREMLGRGQDALAHGKELIMAGQALANAQGKRERKPADKANAISNGRQTRHESRNGGESVADSESEQAGRIQQRPLSAYARANGDGPTTPATWPTEPGVGRVADGIPNRAHRLKLLGNSIVPQVAETILRAMMLVTPNDRAERPAVKEKGTE